ncbi:hypothetical protein D3C74_387440 [compost metagenome]
MLHVEFLNTCRILGNKYRLLILLSNCSLMRRPEILTPRNIKAFRMQEFNRIIISDTRERRFDFLQLADVSTHSLKLCFAIRQNGLYNKRNELFLYLKAFLMVGKSHFRLDHPELDQVTTGFGFLCAERRSK